MGYAETLLIFYCKRMNNPLPWKDLYANKKERAKKVITTIDENIPLTDHNQQQNQKLHDAVNVTAG